MPNKGAKGPKGAKPAWMSDELFALSQNPAQLVETFRAAADKPANERVATREQVMTRCHVRARLDDCAQL
jgi:hypothetical protein